MDSSSAAPRPSLLAPALILGALSLLSAFLLFQVQPIISKFILPWFGGSPGVWTTCMLFFQVVLFAGYAYAHLLTLLPRRWQGIAHGLLLAAAIAALPIAPDAGWKPAGDEDPAARILLLLALSVGLPYFVLSSTSPLVQVWFTRASGGSTPWRLYSLSNIGSLAALLTYPLFFEVRWDVMEQTTLWSVAFGGFVVLSLSGVWMDRRHALEAQSRPPVTIDAAADHPGWGRRVLWVLFPALASCVLLAATNHVCQNVAVIPFLWVVPLSLYLVTFIVCFEHERWYERVPVLWVIPALPLIYFACTHDGLDDQEWWKWDWTPNYLWELGWSFGAMFFACMLCHGELTRLKPAPRRLTEFYLLMSAGGALGGLFASLAAPRLFTTFAEWPISLIGVFFLGCAVLVRGVWHAKGAWAWLLFPAVLASCAWGAWALGKHGVVTLPMVREAFKAKATTPLIVSWCVIGLIALGTLPPAARAIRRGVLRIGTLSVLTLAVPFAFAIATMFTLGLQHSEMLERVRNFYGVLAVTEDYDESMGTDYRQLRNGGIVHGMQNMADGLREDPTTYYGRHTGIGRALESLGDRRDARVGVVGMGAGTVGCYAQAGHTFRFYDINPEVVRVARKHFTYLADAEARGARIDTVVADARLALEREEPQEFDVLLLDAFSGDSVPVHLLTREAFAIYKRHMKPDGIIAVHITNTYLVLAPVIETIAADAGFKTTRVAAARDGDHDSNDYILVTNSEYFLEATPPRLVGNEAQLKRDVRLWTDRYHNLLRILDIPWNVRAPATGGP